MTQLETRPFTKFLPRIAHVFTYATTTPLVIRSDYDMGMSNSDALKVIAYNSHSPVPFEMPLARLVDTDDGIVFSIADPLNRKRALKRIDFTYCREYNTWEKTVAPDEAKRTAIDLLCYGFGLEEEIWSRYLNSAERRLGWNKEDEEALES